MASELMLKIAQARQAKIPDADIISYIGDNYGLADKVAQARQGKVPDAQILEYLASTPLESGAAENQMPWYRNAAIGAGYGLTKAGLGIAQRALEGGEVIRNALGMESNQTNIDRIGGLIQENRNIMGPLLEQSTAANVGEFIGNAAPYLALPGGVSGGVLRRALTGALQGATIGAAQPTVEGESAGMNAALGGATGGAVSGLASILGKAYNTVRGSVPETNPVALGKKYGIDVTLGEATKNPNWQRVETWLETIPVLGLKKFREKQAAQTESAGRSFLSKYMVNPNASDAMLENRAYSSQLFKDLTDEVKSIGNQQIKPDATRKAAAEILERYPDIFKKFQDTKREKIIQSVLSDTKPSSDPYAVLSKLYGVPSTGGKPATINFEEAWALRDGLGEMIGQARKQKLRGEVDETQYAQIKKLYAAVNDDIDSWLSSINRLDIRGAISTANDAYKKYVVKFDIIQRAYDKANREGNFSPKVFANQLDTIIKKDRYLKTFNAGELQEMTGLAKILDVAKRGGQYMENPPTGNRWGPLTLGGAGIGSYMVGGASGAAGAVGLIGLAKFLTATTAGRRLAMSASRLEPSSPMMQAVVNQALNQSGKMAALGITGE